MALIIEDGTIVPDADSYITLVDARVLAVKRGWTLSTDDDIAEAQLRQGYYWLIDTYEDRLKGARVSKDQTGCFPRKGVYARGFEVPEDEIPQDIINAQVSMASSVNDGAETNAIKSDQDLTGFNLQGAYSETYSDKSSKPILPITSAITRMLRPYLVQGGRIKSSREDMSIYGGGM